MISSVLHHICDLKLTFSCSFLRPDTQPTSHGYAASLHTLHQNHVCSGGAVAHLARLAIFFAVQPLFGALR